jgi:hypothetical protein
MDSLTQEFKSLQVDKKIPKINLIKQTQLEITQTKSKTTQTKSEITQTNSENKNNEVSLFTKTSSPPSTTLTLQPHQPLKLTQHHEHHLIVGRLVLLMTRDDESLVLTLDPGETSAYFRNIKSLPPNPLSPSQLWEFRAENASADTWFLFHPATGSAVIKGDEKEIGNQLRCETFQGTPNGNDRHTYVTLRSADTRMTGQNYQSGYFYYGRDKSNNLIGYYAGSLASEIPLNTLWASTYYD